MDGGTALVGAAVVGGAASALGHVLTYIQAKHARSEAKHAHAEAAGVHELARGNGHGDLVTMGEQTLHILGRVEGKLDAHIQDDRAHNA